MTEKDTEIYERLIVNTSDPVVDGYVQPMSYEQKATAVIERIMNYGADGLTIDDILSLEDTQFFSDDPNDTFRDDLKLLFETPLSWFRRIYEYGRTQRKQQLLSVLFEMAYIKKSSIVLKDAITIFTGIGKEQQGSDVNINAMLVFPEDVCPDRTIDVELDSSATDLVVE